MATVAELMTADVQCCTPTETLADAAGTMWREDVGCLPVVDGAGHVLGILTDRDVAIATALSGQPAHEILVDRTLGDPVHVVGASDPIETAVDLMRLHQVRRLPVVDGEGVLRGLLSLGDLVTRSAFIPAATVRKASCEETVFTLAAVQRAHQSPLPVLPVKAARKATKAKAGKVSATKVGATKAPAKKAATKKAVTKGSTDKAAAPKAPSGKGSSSKASAGKGAAAGTASAGKAASSTSKKGRTGSTGPG